MKKYINLKVGEVARKSEYAQIFSRGMHDSAKTKPYWRALYIDIIKVQKGVKYRKPTKEQLELIEHLEVINNYVLGLSKWLQETAYPRK